MLFITVESWMRVIALSMAFGVLVTTDQTKIDFKYQLNDD